MKLNVLAHDCLLNTSDSDCRRLAPTIGWVSSSFCWPVWHELVQKTICSNHLTISFKTLPPQNMPSCLKPVVSSCFTTLWNMEKKPTKKHRDADREVTKCPCYIDLRNEHIFFIKSFSSARSAHKHDVQPYLLHKSNFVSIKNAETFMRFFCSVLGTLIVFFLFQHCDS